VRVSALLSKSLPIGMPQSAQSTDYPPAVWDPSPNYGSRGATPITHVIVHDTEGSFAGSVSWLKNPDAQASAHYVIRSADGYMKQLVREADMAWHVRCWNSWTLGIEHEGYVNQPSYFTPQMYQASAALVRHFCAVHNIPKDRLHIVGHNVWQDPVIFGQLGWTSCNDHTDPGQYWNWNYYMALIVADSTQPVVESHFPHDGAGTVPVYKSISVTFDRPMDISSTQNAFSVTPVTAGVFTWSNDATMLTFKPSVFLLSATPYRVTISTAARGAGGGSLSQPFTLDFTTRAPDTTGPAILMVFPTNGLPSVDPFMGFQIRFDESVVYSSFSGHIAVTDDSSRTLGLTNIAYSDLDDGSLLTFTPKDSLKWGRSYTLSVTPGLKDPLGNLSTTTYFVQFSTLAVPPAQGYVIDGFENNDRGWLQPAGADGSQGIDTANSVFAISNAKKRGGYYSGMLTYTFADSVGGACALAPAAEIPVQSSTGWLGLYLFGDNSRNRLDFLFSTTAGETTIAVDTVTWYGWGFVRLDLATISRPITSLRGIVIRQIAGGEPAGVVYVDNLQSENPVIASVPWTAPASFQLYQNYPNPFNPTTTIYFELQRFDAATIEIFNPLGQRVTTVLDKALEPGRYKVEFDGRGLSSGVYLYRLRTGAGSQMRKMVLLR
jgi:N-acetyl-anhydromuramyl-L-alanine amidase AmpD